MAAIWGWFVEGLPWVVLPVAIWVATLVAFPLWILEIIANRSDKSLFLWYLSPAAAIVVGATSLTILANCNSVGGVLIPMLLGILSLFLGVGIIGTWVIAAKGIARRIKARK